MADDANSTSAVELATEVTIAWLGNPNTTATQHDASTFLKGIHEAVIGLAAGAPRRRLQIPNISRRSACAAVTELTQEEQSTAHP